MSLESRNKMSISKMGVLVGDKNYRWKGGRPKCKVCNKKLSRYDALHCKKHRIIILTEETRQKFRNNQRKIWLGRKFTPEHIKNLSLSHKGKKPVTAWGKGHAPWNRGLKGFMAGEKNNMWRGGITPIHRAIRTSTEYKNWRKVVFERDSYTCQKCQKTGGKLNADHIKPFSTHPELRFDIDNGRTLCEECHRKTDTWGGTTKYKKQEVGIT